VEGVPRKVPARGIEVRWSEEGDRRKGATMARELELRSALDEMRRKRKMTSGSHTHPDKYLGDAWRTVRRPLADCPRGGCYNRLLTTFHLFLSHLNLQLKLFGFELDMVTCRSFVRVCWKRENGALALYGRYRLDLSLVPASSATSDPTET